MPMTIEPRKSLAFPLGGLAVALIVWFGGMAAAAYAFDPSAVIVFAPSRTAVAAIARADGALLTAGAGFATGASDRSGFVQRLYAEGAWFVWPSLTRGCFAAGRFTR
jgi:hypothetical protein